MTSSPEALFQKESDELWTRVTEQICLMLCHTSNAIGDFWIIEADIESDEECRYFFVHALKDNPNKDTNVLEFFKQFKYALYSSQFELKEV
jgi:hypothetical protein